MDDLLTGCPSGDLVQGPLSRAVASRNIHQHWSRNLRGLVATFDERRSIHFSFFVVGVSGCNGMREYSITSRRRLRCW
jgi:hypothetical protein